MPGKQVNILSLIAARYGPRGVCAYIRTALLLRHTHPTKYALLLLHRSQTWVVDQRGKQRLPCRRQVRLPTQNRYDSMGHRNWAAMTAFHLRAYVKNRRAGDMPPRT